MHLQQGASPSMANSPEGLRTILRRLLGNEDYTQVRASLADRWIENPANRQNQQGFEQWTRQLDPQVFQYNRLKPEEKGAYVTALKKASPEGYKRFVENYRWAQQYNLLPGVR